MQGLFSKNQSIPDEVLRKLVQKASEGSLQTDKTDMDPNNLESSQNKMNENRPKS